MTEQTSDSSLTRSSDEERAQRYRDVGAQLKKRREALKLVPADVARELHLPGVMVGDLEAGRVDHISALYRRGYIRNYAEFLGLDADGLLTEAGDDQPPELQEVLPAAKPGWQVDRYLKIATYVIVTVAIVPPLVYFFVAGGTQMLDGDATSTADSSRGAGAPIEAESLPARGDPAGQANDRGTPHVSASALPLNPLRPSSERERPSAAPAAANAAALPGSDLDPPVPVIDLTALDLELLDDSWIEITDAEGTRLEYDLLRGGQKRHYEGRAPFQLLIGRSSAIVLAVNGRAVSWEGDDSGDVAELSVTAEGDIQP